ncbi:FT-interacting protein 1-like protein [Cinnamomum micranthum f. kanehirae]|uniref:FT-interacting protein 1-like protein n=1 Tax=Cinnamomum micranthum f. kanehirae TaxID=337451 RepID=A0A3S3NPK6_9MAGN|nr:FT-interacting protein 1-like protein [Cinnamomum micranthum f. kanehirae]
MSEKEREATEREREREIYLKLKDPHRCPTRSARDPCTPSLKRRRVQDCRLNRQRKRPGRNIKVKGIRSRSILGKVRLTERSFVPAALKPASSNWSVCETGPTCKTRPPNLMFMSQIELQPQPVSMIELSQAVPTKNQQHSSTTMSQELVNYSAHGIKSEPPKTIQTYQASSQEPVDCTLKEMTACLGRGQVVMGCFMKLVQYLFVHVVKARLLPEMEEMPGSLDPFVEVRIGKYRGITKHFEKQRQDPVWNKVFAFSRYQMRSSVLEVVVKDKAHNKDDEHVGIIRFDLNRIPTRIPPESSLAPEWHRL